MGRQGCGEEGLGAGMRRVVVKLFSGATFNDLPGYITTVCRAISRTVAKLCANNKKATPVSACRSTKRFITWARMETSSADTCSSRMMSLGDEAKALATATRCL